ncbi:hypothetical protein MMYC01_200410, partial [Madurella mycetomatis]
LSISESYYERVLNALNAFVCSNASVALVYLAKYDDGSMTATVGLSSTRWLSPGFCSGASPSLHWRS